MDLYQTLTSHLKQDPQLVDEHQNLKKWLAIRRAQQLDVSLIDRLWDQPQLRQAFFKESNGRLVFNQLLLINLLEQKNYLANSYTRYRNKIGLNSRDGQQVVLDFPHKDCLLAGDQTQTNTKKDEAFLNFGLATDQITQLLEPKVLTAITPPPHIEGDQTFPTQSNLVIEGNNLLVLHCLKRRFRGQIKLIYIDPPYNTGNDNFSYNDSFNHSTWLTFMKNRLEIARQLLTDDGLIFISIDENECHYLKVLADDIFGRDNFIGDLIRQTRSAFNLNRNNFNQQHEYALIFAKDKQHALLKGDRKTFTSYKNPDNDPNGDWLIDNPSIVGSLNTFAITNPHTNQVDRPPIGRGWSFSEQQLPQLIKAGKIVFLKAPKPKQRGFILKRYRKDIKNRFSAFDSLLVGSQYFNAVGTKELIALLGRDQFSFPKPVSFIKKIIAGSAGPDDIILDFFAGSGTTAEAVLRLNQKDGGRRRFILVEQLKDHVNVARQRIDTLIKNELIDDSYHHLELKKHNQVFINQIKNADSSQSLEPIWDQMHSRATLDYSPDWRQFKAQLTEFKGLNLSQQKQILVDLLDKNQLYVNLSSLEDDDFQCSLAERQLTKHFYGL